MDGYVRIGYQLNHPMLEARSVCASRDLATTSFETYLLPAAQVRQSASKRRTSASLHPKHNIVQILQPVRNSIIKLFSVFCNSFPFHYYSTTKPEETGLALCQIESLPDELHSPIFSACYDVCYNSACSTCKFLTNTHSRWQESTPIYK
ncbi:hypothetical protein CBL_03762 [Carabus blaptoides fortunei]